MQRNAKKRKVEVIWKRFGQLIDEAMTVIERDNKTLNGALPPNYARPALNKSRLGELIDLIATIGFGAADSIA